MLRDFRSTTKKVKMLSLKRKNTKRSSSEESGDGTAYSSDLGNISLVQTPVSLEAGQSFDKQQSTSTNGIHSSNTLEHNLNTTSPYTSSNRLENSKANLRDNTASKYAYNANKYVDIPDFNKDNGPNGQKPFSFDSSVKLSENPFDVFNGSLIKIEETAERPKITKTETTDEFILSGLKRSRSQSKELKNTRRAGIFNKIVAISKAELSIGTKKYYKFPFDISVANDESSIFSAIKGEFVTAFSSAYSNYRKFGESFKVSINEEVFSFSNTISCPISCSRLLKTNDIKYTVDNEVITIEQNDVGLVFDTIMNLDIPKGRPIPFILSSFEFENGIVFRTKVQKGPVIRSREGVEYSYTLIGPFDTSDFSFDDTVIIEYL